VVDLAFTAYARWRMGRRQIPIAAVYHIVEDADEIIERDDERTEYFGGWEGRSIMVVTEGSDEPLLVVNAIDRRRGGR
jgi:hypothetical protein